MPRRVRVGDEGNSVNKRLDAQRLALWRSYRHVAASIDAEIARELDTAGEHELVVFEVLALLDASGGRMRMQEISEALVIKRSTFTRLIDRMDAKGLVARELTTDDGRGVVAVLTNKGQRAFLRARPTYRRSVQQLFARHLTDTDVNALVRILHKLDIQES